MKKRTMKSLWMFTKKSRLYFAGALLSVVAACAFDFLGPMVLSNTVDSILFTKPFDLPAILQTKINAWGGRDFLVKNLWIPGLVLVAIYFFRDIFNFLRGRWIAVASEGVARRIRDKVYNHLQRLPFDYHVKAETGDLIQRSTTDVDTVRRFLAAQLVETVRVITMVVIALVILLGINPGLTALSLMLTPVMVVVSYIFFKKIQAQFTIVEEADGRMSTVLQENLAGVRVVRAFGREAFERQKFAKANDNMRDLNIKLTKYFAGFWGGSDLLVMIQNLIALTAGVLYAVKGSITVGESILFISYVRMMLWPIRQFGRVLADMGRMIIAMERIDHILDAPEETSGENPVTPAIDCDIEFDNVEFCYDDGKPILKGMSFTVKAGETVAILGSTGSGKSSLMHLLQRLYEYQKGSIRIGGVELNTIDKHHLRSHVGIVLQEPFLYSKTIKENIAITSPGNSEEQVFEAARMASLHDVINEFEKGYETVVGERGVTLSGGQKQRVAIARTVLKDYDILIFDDSLSAVDTQTDAKIRAELKKRRRGVTTFIISHRLSTLMEADRILVMEDGHIVQQGNHSELLESEGLYRRIWEIQTSLKEEEMEEGEAS